MLGPSALSGSTSYQSDAPFEEAGITSDKMSTVTNPATNAEQLNKTFASLAALKQWTETLRNEIATGRPVCVIQAGYGSSRYAMFNVKRWNATAGDHICNFEDNGLPVSWVQFLRALAVQHRQFPMRALSPLVTQISFPLCVLAVDNARVADMLTLYASLEDKLGDNALSDVLLATADCWLTEKL